MKKDYKEKIKGLGIGAYIIGVGIFILYYIDDRMANI